MALFSTTSCPVTTQFPWDGWAVATLRNAGELRRSRAKMAGSEVLNRNYKT
jgi:hypothetical protein